MNESEIHNQLLAYRQNAEPQTQPEEEVKQEVEAITAEPEEITAENVEIESESESPNDDLIEFKADGQLHRMSLEEVKKLASAGFDYTKKTQELSSRVNAEAEKFRKEYEIKLGQEKDGLLKTAKMFEALYDRPIATQEQLEKLINEGEYEEYQRLTFQENKRKELLANARTEIDKIESERAAKRQEEYNAYALKESEMLYQKMPEFKEADFQQRFVKYLLDSGFTGQEIQNAVDHRTLVIAEKARRYDELMGKKGTLPDKKEIPKVIKKVGTVQKTPQTMKEMQSAFDRLKQSKSGDDAVEMFKLIRKNS